MAAVACDCAAAVAEAVALLLLRCCRGAVVLLQAVLADEVVLSSVMTSEWILSTLFRWDSEQARFGESWTTPGRQHLYCSDPSPFSHANLTHQLHNSNLLQLPVVL